MKKNLTEFKCDEENCKEVIKIEAGEDYPYNEKWCYIYNLELKIPQKFIPSSGETTYLSKGKNGQDKHFCCKHCAIKWFIKLMEAK